MDDFETVQDRLTQLHPTLPPQLRKAATYLLDNPREIATESMRKVATQSGIPFANFARLAQAVGFEKYSDLRDVYRRSVQLGGAEGYPEKAAKLQASGKSAGDDVVWSSFLEAAEKNLSNVYKRIDSKLAGAIADKLIKKRHIYLAGMQASHPFAAYFDYVGGMVLPSMKLLGRQGGVIADDLTDLDSQDALICIAIRPCARATVQVAKLAFDRGAFVVAITDSRASPLVPYSSETLITPCQSPLFFESYLGSTAIIELLIGFLTVRSGTSAIQRIERIESDRTQLDEYWTPTKGRSRT